MEAWVLWADIRNVTSTYILLRLKSYHPWSKCSYQSKQRWDERTFIKILMTVFFFLIDLYMFFTLLNEETMPISNDLPTWDSSVTVSSFIDIKYTVI